MKKIILFNMPGFEEMAEAILKEFDMVRGRYDLKRFKNGEAQIVLKDDIKGSECLVLGTNAPPDERVIELFFLCHTLKKEEAKKVSLILPYFAYTRQEKEEPQKSLAMDWFGKNFKICGVDEIITVDIHTPLAKRFFKMRLISLYPAQIFADEIKRISFADATIVAPDEGALVRCEQIRKILGTKQPVSHFVKKRDGEVIHSSFRGEVGNRAILIDDILDTGNTLIAACRQLKQEGVKEIIIIITHGLFTGDKWQELWNMGVKRIYVTDTLPEAKEKISEKISILSIIPAIKNYLHGR